MLKAAVAVLLIASLVGVGWIVLYDDDGLTVSVRVNQANLADPDGIPMNVDVRFESSRDEDVRVDSIRLEILTEEGGQRVVKRLDGQFVIPAGGETVRNYDLFLENVDDVGDTVYIILDVQLDGGEVKHTEREIELDEYAVF
jgi:hypothetical protein